MKKWWRKPRTSQRFRFIDLPGTEGKDYLLIDHHGQVRAIYVLTHRGKKTTFIVDPRDFEVSRRG